MNYADLQRKRLWEQNSMLKKRCLEFIPGFSTQGPTAEEFIFAWETYKTKSFIRSLVLREDSDGSTGIYAALHGAGSIVPETEKMGALSPSAPSATALRC
ncbi:hypothetical protein CVT26_000554 [Gymnopilus dilepis]|uniref:Uncharacterized protein n=1 Tax=Gymnopilus dilepis TaxID=231916 RepID=A0A409VH98_9AGAR|nr:hypothetical protein CVT26_000554 [Gymnopilus dilepis]